MNTEVMYYYRNPRTNMRHRNFHIIFGELDEQQMSAIMSAREQGCLFIPCQVGLAEDRGIEFIGTEDDIWFELDDDAFYPTDSPADLDVTAFSLAEAFARKAGRWDEDAAWQRLEEMMI